MCFRHVTFLEHIPLYFIPTQSHDLTRSYLHIIEPVSINDDDTSSDGLVHDAPTNTTLTPSTPTTAPTYVTTPTLVVTPELPPPRRSARTRKTIMLTNFAYSFNSPTFASFIANIQCLPKLDSYKEIISNPFWQNAMVKEFITLYQTHTWDLVSLPPGKHMTGCHWVYKIKFNSDGSVEPYRVKLVIKGCLQKYGMDYEETFSHVAKIMYVLTLFDVSFIHQWGYLPNGCQECIIK